ncbi:MAG: XrtA/PEP-CTERM system TPR-repeat protein PrsT [Pseudomonadota bacterium]
MILVVGIVLLATGCGREPAEVFAAAEQARTEGDYRLALTEYRNVLQQDANDFEARVGLGVVYFHIGDYQQAVNEFEKAKQQGRESIDRLSYESRSFLALQRPDLALQNVPAIEDLGAENAAEAMLIRARVNVQNRRWSAAEQLFDEVDAIAPSLSARVLAGRAEMSLVRGDTLAARAQLEALLQQQPGNIDALNNLARLEIIDDNGEQAIAYLSDMARESQRIGNRPSHALALSSLIKLQLTENDLIGATETLGEIERHFEGTPMHNSAIAEVLLAEDQPAEALVAAQRALASDSDHVPYLMLVAKGNLALGNLATAERNALRVLAIEPRNQEAVQFVTNIRISQGRFDAATEVLRAQGDSASTNLQVMVATALADLDSGNVDAAIDGFETALAIDPYNSSIRVGLARAYMVAGRNAEAASILGNLLGATADDALINETVGLLDDLQRNDTQSALARGKSLVRDYPDDRHSWLALAFVENTLGDAANAERSVSQAITLSPEYAPAIRFRAEIRETLGDVTGATWDLTTLTEQQQGVVGDYLRLSALHARGDLVDRAIDVLDQGLAVFPEDLSILNNLAQLHIIAGNESAASEITRRAMEIAPNDPRASLMAAQLAYTDGRSEQALQILRGLYSRDDTNAQVARALARLLARLDDADGAREVALRAVELQSDDREMAELACEATLQLGEADAGIACGRQLVASDPSIPSGHILIGRAAMLAGRPDDGVDAFRRAYELSGHRGDLMFLVRAEFARGNWQVEELLRGYLAKNRSDEGIQLLLAEAYSRGGNTAAAEDVYQRVLASNPNNVIAANNLAWMWRDSSPQQAEELAVLAAQSAPQDAGILDTAGWILLNNGKTEESIKYLRQAVDRSGKNPEVVYHLAVALQRSGDGDAAADLLEESLSSDVPFDSREDAEALLITLRQ